MTVASHSAIPAELVATHLYMPASVLVNLDSFKKHISSDWVIAVFAVFFISLPSLQKK